MRIEFCLVPALIIYGVSLIIAILINKESAVDFFIGAFLGTIGCMITMLLFLPTKR